MYTLRNDQLQIFDAYNNILLEKEINYDLNELYNSHLINEGFLDDIRAAGEATGQVASKVANSVSSTIDSTSRAVADISKLPDQLSTYFNIALPQYLDKLGQYLLIVLESGAAGAVLTYALGKLIMLLAKRVSKETQRDYQAITAMLPAHVQDRVKKIESLKQTDPAKYRKMVFQINKNAIKQLEKELIGTGRKIQRAVIAKSLSFLGNALSSGPGSLAGGIAIAVIIQKLGFNPLPIFPSL